MSIRISKYYRYDADHQCCRALASPTNAFTVSITLNKLAYDRASKVGRDEITTTTYLLNFL